MGIYRPPEGYVFIRHGITESDINQGSLGSCWLLSTVGSFASMDDKSLIENVLNAKFNQKNGPREGKLVFRFYRFNKFEDVVIDDRLPLIQQEMAEDSRDWWVPLIEKAYAKFYGSYKLWSKYELNFTSLDKLFEFNTIVEKFLISSKEHRWWIPSSFNVQCYWRHVCRY